jgi:methionyl aminopeptidase
MLDTKLYSSNFTNFIPSNMAKIPKIIIKTPEQIEGIRKSSRLAASVLNMIEPYIKPGVSTEELDQICNTYILNNGGISACI